MLRCREDKILVATLGRIEKYQTNRGRDGTKNDQGRTEPGPTFRCYGALLYKDRIAVPHSSKHLARKKKIFALTI